MKVLKKEIVIEHQNPQIDVLSAITFNKQTPSTLLIIYSLACSMIKQRNLPKITLSTPLTTRKTNSFLFYHTQKKYLGSNHQQLQRLTIAKLFPKGIQTFIPRVRIALNILPIIKIQKKVSILNANLKIIKRRFSKGVKKTIPLKCTQMY